MARPKQTCTSDGCNRPAHGQGLCDNHYRRWRATEASGPRCSAEDCDRPAVTKGYCRRHYQRLLKHGDVTVIRQARWRETSWDRAKSKILVDDQGCWVWTGTRSPLGYGQLRLNYKLYSAHRWVYEQLVGTIPEGLELDHLCRNPPCCNPSHLEPVTHRENILRGSGWAAVNARRTECVNGHAFTPENTKFLGSGRRRCKECHRQNARARYAKARAAKGLSSNSQRV